MLNIYQEYYNKLTEIVHIQFKIKTTKLAEGGKQFKIGAIHQFPDSQSFLHPYRIQVAPKQHHDNLRETLFQLLLTNFLASRSADPHFSQQPHYIP